MRRFSFEFGRTTSHVVAKNYLLSVTVTQSYSAFGSMAERLELNSFLPDAAFV
jgi:hypothetical protein